MKKDKYLNLVEQYIKAKIQGGWAESTAKDERYRLSAIDPKYIMDAQKMFTYLSKERKLSKYSLQTTFIRITDFFEWAMEESHLKSPYNIYRKFRKEKGALFKNHYEPERIDITFDEAMEKIKSIDDPEIRGKAYHLLATGARWKESLSVDKDGFTVTKGGRKRKLFVAKTLERLIKPDFSRNYTTFLRGLASVGLKPHTLRKLAATQLVRQGVDLSDLKEIMGWKSIQTANSYLQPQKEDKLQEIMNKALRKGKS